MARIQINGPEDLIGLGEEQGYISFGSGQPDIPPPQVAMDARRQFDGFKYCPVQGILQLREAICRLYKKAEVDNVVVTNGASEATDLALRGLCNIHGVGSRVLVPKPYYYSYPYNVKQAKMEPVFYQLENGKINTETLEGQLDDPVALILNSPANPTGSIQDKETVGKVQEMCRAKGVTMIVDGVYNRLAYEELHLPDEEDHVIHIDSTSKTYGMCGERVGWLYAQNPEYVKQAVGIKTHTSMNTPITGQAMAHAALTQTPDDYHQNTFNTWKGRRDLFWQGMQDLGLDAPKPEGAFYLFPKIEGRSPIQVVNDLFNDHNMIAYAGDWFGDPERVRFSYVVDEDKIKEGLERLGQYIESIRNDVQGALKQVG